MFAWLLWLEFIAFPWASFDCYYVIVNYLEKVVFLFIILPLTIFSFEVQ